MFLFLFPVPPRRIHPLLHLHFLNTTTKKRERERKSKIKGFTKGEKKMKREIKTCHERLVSKWRPRYIFSLFLSAVCARVVGFGFGSASFFFLAYSSYRRNVFFLLGACVCVSCEPLRAQREREKPVLLSQWRLTRSRVHLVSNAAILAPTRAATWIPPPPSENKKEIGLTIDI